jgi:uncharacterized phosphosugar-binding protein
MENREHTLVLDNEALQALVVPGHRKHRSVLAFVDAVATRNRRRPGAALVVVPTAVRVEAAVDRRSRDGVSLGRHRVADVVLDRENADQAAGLRHVGGSAVDACVAQAAAVVVAGRVTVLTADLTDIPRLLAEAGADRAIAHRL